MGGGDAISANRGLQATCVGRFADSQYWKNVGSIEGYLRQAN